MRRNPPRRWCSPGVRALRDAQFWKLQHPELLAVGRLFESIGRSVYAAQVRCAGEVDDTDLATQLSVSSARVLLLDTLRITAGDAAGRVRAARCTLERDPISGGHLPARLPLLGAALDDGTVGEGTSRSSPRPSRRSREPSTRSWWSPRSGCWWTPRRKAHQSEWTIKLGADRRPRLHPTHLDRPPTTPRRNHTHRPLGGQGAARAMCLHRAQRAGSHP